MELKKLIRNLSKYYPFSQSDEWDYPGYQSGHKVLTKDVKIVLLCLDFTEAVFNVAKEVDPDLILTHHPFIFGKKSEVLLFDYLKAKLEVAIFENLHCPIYSYHTCFDKGKGGMNDTLLKILGYDNIEVAEDGLTRVVRLDKSTTVVELANQIKEKFSLPYVFYHQGSKKEINNFAFVAGGGASMFLSNLQNNIDLYISGDCTHHTRVDIIRYDYNYIDISHEVEELGFLTGMKETLLKIDSSLKIVPVVFENDFNLVS